MSNEMNENEKRKIKIAHSLEDLEQQLVLTLKDRPILNNGQIDEQIDILQNIEVQQTSEAHHYAELRDKVKKLADVSTSHLEAKNQGISTMLPHYDDHRYQAKSIEVQEGQNIITRKQNKAKKLPSDFEERPSKNGQFCNFRQIKPKKNNNPQNILQYLNDTADDNEIEYLKRSADSIVSESLENVKKKKMIQQQIKDQIKNQSQKKITIENDEETILLQSLKIKKKFNNEVSKRQKSVLEMVKEQQQQILQKKLDKTNIELNPISFNLKQQNIIKKYTINDIKKGTSSAMFLNLPSQEHKKVIEKQKQEEIEMNFNQQELQAMKQQLKFMEEKQIGTGLSGTLSYLRQNALIGKQQYAGRSTDKQFQYNSQNQRIKLQYRNSNGKIMKPKQAYRYLCAKFHGQGPSQNKIEKRKKKELEEMRMKERMSKNSTMLSMLQKHQQKSKQAHLVLEFGK